MESIVKIRFIAVASCMLAGFIGLAAGALSKSEKCPATGWETKRAIGPVELQAEIDATITENDDACITPRRMRKVLHDLNRNGDRDIATSIDAQVPDHLPPSSSALRDILTRLNK